MRRFVISAYFSNGGLCIWHLKSKSVINIELVQEGGKLIFSVRNPVVEKVQVTDGTGLLNVKAMAGCE